MSQNADEVVIGANGNFYTAPYSASLALPDAVDDTLDAKFAQHGFVSEDGVTFTDGKEIEDIEAWQSFYPIRKVISSKSSKLELVLRQFNNKNVQLAFGGGSIDTAGGDSIYVPPAPGELDERSAVVEWNDGDYSFMLVVPKGIVTDDVETNLVRTAAADLPIGFEATPAGNPTVGDETSYPWYIVSDHPAFADVSSS